MYSWKKKNEKYNMNTGIIISIIYFIICVCHFVFLAEHVNNRLGCLNLREHTIYREFSPRFIFIQLAHIDNALT